MQTEIENNHKFDLSIIVPIYNEENSIYELYFRIQKTLKAITDNYEIIFINDGSKDDSLIKILKICNENEKVFYINLSRNFGHQIAITAGLDICDSQATIILDGDLQHPPELIIDLYSKYKEGYEVVYAKRKHSQNERFFKKKSAKIFYLLLRKITNIEIPLNTGDFRIIDQKVVNLLREMPEQNKFLRGQIAWLGFNQTEILFSIDKRKHGKSSYSFAKMFRFAIDGITSFSDVPLQVVTKAGIIISFVSLFIIFYAIYAHFIIKQTITGWTSLIISSMFIGGVQLISIGIIGEYISRINKNILKRPLYIIEKSNIKKNRFQKKDIKIY